MTPLTPYEQGAVIVYETAEIPEEIDFRPKTSSAAGVTQEEKKFLWQKSAEKESPVIPSYAATTEPQVERCAENNEGKIGKISEQRKEIFVVKNSTRGERESEHGNIFGRKHKTGPEEAKYDNGRPSSSGPRKLLQSEIGTKKPNTEKALIESVETIHGSPGEDKGIVENSKKEPSFRKIGGKAGCAVSGSGVGDKRVGFFCVIL